MNLEELLKDYKMIPKIVHYIWLGKNQKSELANKCINSWRKYCPDFEIKEWNEDNFPINENLYCKQAYLKKKYAFASDYIRMYVLEKYGGFYFDTDLELIKPLCEDLLSLHGIYGFETTDKVMTAFIGSEPHNEIIKRMLTEYASLKFIDENGRNNLKTNVERLSRIIERYGFELDGRFQKNNGVILVPKEWFSPKDWYSGKIHISEQTMAIHHFDESWVSGSKKLKNILLHIIGKKNANTIKQIWK